MSTPLLKICVLAACPFPANHGTPGSIRELTNSLAEAGHEVHLVTYPHGEEMKVHEAVKIHRVAKWSRRDRVVVGPTWKKPFYDFLMVFKAIQICWKYDIDLIHAHLYEAAIAAWLTRSVTFRKFVYSGHNTMQDELASYNFFRSQKLANGLGKFLDHFVPARADRCIPHSKNIETFFFERGLRSRTEGVINFGIDLNDLQQRRHKTANDRFHSIPKPLIVYTGILDHFQRLDLLLGAMKLVLQARPEARLVIAMTLDQPEFRETLQRKVDALGLSETVQFTDRISFEECLQLLERADIAVSPRPDTPGFPIKLLNYLAMETPVVMFESSSNGVRHREEVWLAPEDTAESLADGLVELLDDQSLRVRLASNGHRFVFEHHDSSKVTSKLIHCFLKVLKGTRRWKKISKRETVPFQSPVSAETAREKLQALKQETTVV